MSLFWNDIQSKSGVFNSKEGISRMFIHIFRPQKKVYAKFWGRKKRVALVVCTEHKLSGGINDVCVWGCGWSWRMYCLSGEKARSWTPDQARPACSVMCAEPVCAFTSVSLQHDFQRRWFFKTLVCAFPQKVLNAEKANIIIHSSVHPSWRTYHGPCAVLSQD